MQVKQWLCHSSRSSTKPRQFRAATIVFMLICGTSDFHGRLPPDIDACDVLLIAGDICPHGRPANSMSDRVFQRQWLIATFLPWIRRQPCGAWFMTGGNHDFVLQSPLVRDTLPSVLLDGLLLDRTAGVLIGGELIRVHGSPWSLPFRNWGACRFATGRSWRASRTCKPGSKPCCTTSTC